MTKPNQQTTIKTANGKASNRLLDGSGTSQKAAWNKMSFGQGVITPDSLPTDLKKLSERAKQQKCINDAPMICIPPKDDKPARLFQGTCNSWNCPRCGLMRAATEYARMCEGIKNLQKQGRKLFMITITTKGTVTSAAAEKSYLADTNRLLTVMRAEAKRNDCEWRYVAITERQKRGNPHTHMITTYCPQDAFYISDNYPRYVREVAILNRWLPIEMRFTPKKPQKIKEGEMFSRWLCMKSVSAGLGVQCNISRLRNVVAAGIYIAKYLFKSAVDERWPKGWKRIRYSQNWDKLPEPEETEAFPVLTREDWVVVSLYKAVETDDPNVYEIALLRGCYNTRCTVPNPIDYRPTD